MTSNLVTQHEFLGFLSAALQLYSSLPYFVGIFKREVKPHVFTWLVFAILAGIAFTAQHSDGAGPGTWLTAINAVVCFLFALLALKFGTKNIVRSDWYALAFSLLAIPVWMATHNPLWSVIMVCVIDTVAFWPTVRKSWHAPREENIQSFLCSGIAALLAVAAVDHVTITTTLYPLWLALMNLPFVTMMAVRRRIVNN